MAGKITELTANPAASLTGLELLELVKDPAGTPLSRKEVAAHFIPPIRPYYIDSGNYLTSHLNTNGAAALTAGRLYQNPIYIPYSRDFTKLATWVSALQGSSGIRLGIYTVNQITMQPLALVVEATTIDASTGTGSTGLKEQAITQTLGPGFYSLACCTDGTPSVPLGTNLPQVNLGSTFNATMRPTQGLVRNFTYGALPADESAQAYTAANSGTYTGVPILGIR